MKLSSSALLLLLVHTATAAISRQECIDQDGEIVSDIGDGAIYLPDFVCMSTAEPPTDHVEATDEELSQMTDLEKHMASSEVCCGGTGPGLDDMTASTFGDVAAMGTGTNGTDGCGKDSDCPVINCFAAPCDSYVCSDGVCKVQAPQSQCQQDSDCEQINCFVPPCDSTLCNDGVCQLVIEGEGNYRKEISRADCTDTFMGVIVGDIGDGSTQSPDYICDSNGQPPLGNIVVEPDDEEPMATEGEVCCGQAPVSMTREECTDDFNGVLVGDIGDGATFRANYVCESSGQAPLGIVVAQEGQPISKDGEVCCGQKESNNTTVTSETETEPETEPQEPEDEKVTKDATQPPSFVMAPQSTSGASSASPMSKAVAVLTVAAFFKLLL